MKTHLGILFYAMALASCATYPELDNRPTSWTTPIELEGVPNLQKIDDNLYRSAQPSTLGMKNLQKIGIKTVIDLRYFSDDKDECAGTSLNRVEIPMLAWKPNEDVTKRFLATITNKSDGPFLVHCQHGADRTGSMSAIYRVQNQGWKSEDALQEMLYGGFGYHKIWTALPAWTQKQAEEGWHLP